MGRPERNRTDDPPAENHLLLRHEDGRLQVEVLTVEEGGRESEARTDAVTHAQIILSTCTAANGS